MAETEEVLRNEIKFYEEELARCRRKMKCADIALRDEFAAKAIQGMLASGTPGNNYHMGHEGNGIGLLTVRAYTLADAMLKARESKEEDNNV